MYRGQIDYSWHIESTLVRNIIKLVYEQSYSELNQNIRNSTKFHHGCVNVLLNKFQNVVLPNEDLMNVSDVLDPEYEVCRYIQQFSNEDIVKVQGTHCIDWSLDPLVSLYFSVFDDNEKISPCDGALYCYDFSKSENIVSGKFKTILELMENDVYKKREYGLAPLIHQPHKISTIKRADNQDAIYLMQMDFSKSIEEITQIIEKEKGITILHKIKIPSFLKNDIAEYLFSKGYNQKYIFPEEVFYG